MKRYKPFFKFEELRKNPEMNPHIGAWDYVDKYKDDKDVYISFTEIDKIGLNPQSKYNTPLGIYTYPLKEFYIEYLPQDFSKRQYEESVGDFAPFAGSAKYVNFIRVKDKSHFINDMYKDYGSNDYDRDIKILEKRYGKSQFLYDYDNGEDNFKDFWDNFIAHTIAYAKEQNPIMSMWNITRLLSEKLSNNAKQASTKWNLILSKDLGYSGFADKSGKGYIHPSEPMQAVFFNTRAFEVIARVENVPAKKNRN